MNVLRISVFFILSMILSSAFADVYMGTGADQGWSPLYPSAIAEPMINTSASSTVTSIIPAPPLNTAPSVTSQQGQFIATYSPSASSYSSTNYAALAPVSSASTAVALDQGIPCQTPSVDMIYGKGPLVAMPCPSANAVLGERPVIYPLHTGSLKANVAQMIKESGWGTLVWNVPNDYRWMGNISITATSIQGALDQLLAPYPVQAVFYDTNHIIDIEPRRQA